MKAIWQVRVIVMKGFCEFRYRPFWRKALSFSFIFFINVRSKTSAKYDRFKKVHWENIFTPKSALSEAKFAQSVLDDKVVNLSIMSLIGFESPAWWNTKILILLLLKGTIVPFNWRATFHSSQTKVYFDSFCLKWIVSPIIRSAVKLSSRHFNFHRKCVSQLRVIFVILFHPSHQLFFSSHEPFYSQPSYSSWWLGILWCLFRAI